MLQNEIAPPPVLSRLSGGGLRLMPGRQASPRAPGACRRSAARRLPGAACRTCSVLWPPTAAALCRVAFAGGLFPFPAFERSRAFFLPLSFFPRCFISRSCTDSGLLRGVTFARVERPPASDGRRDPPPPRHRRRC